MSFAATVKDELLSIMPQARHCRLAEIGAIYSYCGGEPLKGTPLYDKYLTLQNKSNMLDLNAEMIIKRSCCQRAYIRGAFLSAGYINDPNKSYDLEFVCDTKAKALKLKEHLKAFGLEPKLTDRNLSYVLYIKDAEGIVDTLNIMGAHRSLMYLEALRVEKDVRNSVNRKVNCETANIKKSVSASEKQIEDIRKIEAKMGLKKLPVPLYEIAMLRLENEESSLAELGEMLTPPVGKSGVNHRMRKLGEIAGKL